MNFDVKILIVEDEVLIASYIFKILESEGYTNLKMVHEHDDAINMINTFLPDLILMDINLSGINSGIELAKVKNDNAKIIFLTGQFDFKIMNNALQTKPESYLTKPIKKVDLLAAINLASQKLSDNYITLKNGYENLRINIDEILFVKSDNNYCEVHTIFNQHLIKQSLNTIISSLPTAVFVQTHRCFVVNKYKISKRTASAVFVNEIEIPLSRTFAKNQF
jgi:DNA-binding LytR/AlgR family response regulator